ncbi:hypothetical protein, partial [Mesorhizobium sp. M4A.F.Ca.ET.050.02.1.1]|uniref:hypothetical protein n=1 Tax=Mesorhizobium sp. M4A.F.Ca.ET.050.02.1.1 TaxID=2496754 RepID=UPI001AECE6DE
MAAHQKLLLEKLEKQAEQNAGTTNLLSRILDRDRGPAPPEIPHVAPVPASQPSAETSIFMPISEVAAQGRQPAAEATFQDNGTDSGPHQAKAPEPVVE